LDLPIQQWSAKGFGGNCHLQIFLSQYIKPPGLLKSKGGANSCCKEDWLKPNVKFCPGSKVLSEDCASFLDEWCRKYTNDANTARSRTGHIIMYGSCPISWCSKLQINVAHSSTEAEKISFYHALKEVTAIIYLLGKLKEINFKINASIPACHFNVVKTIK
jgi:hypothetical protein